MSDGFPAELVGVVGAGLMGSGIAQVVATAGGDVVLVDVDAGALRGGLSRMTSSLDRLAAKGKTAGQTTDEVLTRVRTTTELADLEAADVVIEAVPENLALKQQTFVTLESVCGEETMLATNTSQFPIGQVSARVSRRDRVIGMHWSNPPPLMQLVEIVVADSTTAETLHRAELFVAACGRRTVVCRRDIPGFISNRISTALFMEAARLVDEGVASAAEIDQVAQLMFGHAMGPLATLDLAGLDTALSVAEALSDFYGDRFAPPDVLATLVGEGRLGRKTGSGFFDY